MTIYLVRHGRAGNRAAWLGDDEDRPLSDAGHMQARLLVDVLDDAQFEHILSSPYVRCMETVVPLAAARRMAVEPAEGLAEGADLADTLELIRKYAGSGAVMCTHGDVLPMILEYARQHGVDLGRNPKCPKGCTWVLETDGTYDIREARYLPPPSS